MTEGGDGDDVGDDVRWEIVMKAVARRSIALVFLYCSSLKNVPPLCFPVGVIDGVDIYYL